METSGFKFLKGTWITAKNFTEMDVGLLIDKNNKTMYLWEGNQVEPNALKEAKQLLGFKKAKYPNYKVRSARNEVPEQIKEIINNFIVKIEEDSGEYLQKISKIVKIQKILTLITILFLSIVVAQLVLNINFNEFNILGDIDDLFSSYADYSQFMLLNLIFCLISILLITALDYLFSLTKSSVKLLIGFVSIIILFCNVIWSWSFQGSIIIIGIVDLLLVISLFLPPKLLKKKTLK